MVSICTLESVPKSLLMDGLHLYYFDIIQMILCLRFGMLECYLSSKYVLHGVVVNLCMARCMDETSSFFFVSMVGLNADRLMYGFL